MRTLTLIQGSPEWHAHRAKARNASDAPAMLGCSPYQTRTQLLTALHIGIRPEPTREQQVRFDAGHAIEAAQRPFAEEVIGEDLYPVVGCEVVDGIELSASFDGLTMLEDQVYECKTLNDTLRQAFDDIATIAPEYRDVAGGKVLPEMYRAQMEQQLAVCGGRRVLFVAATKDGSDVRHCWYYPDPAMRAKLIAGWKQLDQDLATFTPPTATPVVVAAPVQALPAVSVQVTGSISIVDNFSAFELAVRAFIEHRLIREPKTDQDFADLDVQIKAMKGAEAALDAAEAQMLAQIQTVDTAKKTKDMLAKLVRDNRLMAEKLLATEKERRRGEIVAGGIAALRQTVDGWNTRLGKPYMPAIAADFAGVIKGKKSLTSMEEAVAVELARARAAADQVGACIQVNQSTLRELAKDHAFLFADAATLVLKATDDCRAVVTARIAEHKTAEEKRAAELAERERERIRQEEAARLQREQEAAAKARAEEDRLEDQRQQREHERQLAEKDKPGTPPPVVVPLVRPTAAPAATALPATLNLGAICERMGFTMTADFLKRMGIEPAAVDKNAKKFTEAQFQQLCDSLVAHIRTVAHQQQAA